MTAVIRRKSVWNTSQRRKTGAGCLGVSVAGVTVLADYFLSGRLVWWLHISVVFLGHPVRFTLHI